ncbi:hypothetical protein [Fictibacillus barbaricus]|uniref:ABC transmembrane type-1 domain-containing protein n=1 Tax=Fictibacillus barbaricus TaxID=182136 RepID=A0ABU1U5K2_9BACL|nr:hypothetical protein [Fictibacillus barbaricus]MDR7074726.1 hypothetical protein [Fictibacillus barbaricus]
MHSKQEIINIKNIFISILIIVILAVFLSWLYEYVKFLPINQKDDSSFVNTIFQIHSSISIASTALLTLIINLKKEKIYGLKTLDTMSIKNSFYINFYDEIVVTLLLLTVQYFFVAFVYVPGVAFIFFINFGVIIHLLYKSIEVSLFEERVKQKIYNQVLDLALSSIKEENARIKEREVSNGENN